MKVLIAVDSSEVAHDAATVAQRLFPDAEHVIIGAASLAPYTAVEPLGGGYFPSGPDLEAVREGADDAVASARDALGEESATLVQYGDAGRVICEQAVAQAADVVVVGRSSKNWLSRLSDYVVHNAPCPVLVVREQT